MLHLKKVSIYLLLLMMFASAIIPGGIEELCKLPTLMGHYSEHKSKSANLSFTDFLFMHYDEMSNHRKEENHEDLPLFHTCCNSVTLFVTELAILNGASTGEQIATSVAYIPTHYDYDFHLSIFQPPRLG